MLDAFIIEQIRKRERAETDDSPTIQLPLHEEREPTPRPREQDSRPRNDDESPRGVIVIDFA